MVATFEQLRTKNLKTFDELRVKSRPPDYGMAAIPKEKLPGVWDYNKQLDQLLGDPEIDIEKTLPLDVRYDFGRIIGMTEKPDETKDKMATSLFYSVEFGIPPSVSFNLLDEFNKIAFNGKIPASTAWGRIKQRYRTGKSEVQLMDMGFDILKGTWQDWEKYDRSVKNIDKLQSGMTIDQRKEFRNFFEKLVGASAELAPFGLEAAKEMPLGAAIGGTLFGIAAALTTVAIPTIGEEIPAITAATLTGIKVGAGVRGAMRVGQLEAGGQFLELARMKDQYGNRIDPRIAVVASHAVGAINGGIELAEWTVLLGTFGIGKKLFDKSVRKVTHRLLTQGTLKELIARKALDYSIALGAETLQEIEQETTNIVFGELAKELNNAREGTDFKPITGDDLKARYQEVTVESMRAFGLMVLPGTTISGALELVAQKKEAAAKPVGKPGVVEVKAEIPPTEGVQATEPPSKPIKPTEGIEIPPKAVEGKPEAKITPAKAKKIKAFHGTRADIDTFRPLSHFGTEKAAERALESVKGKGKAKIISVELTLKNPLEVKDTVGTQEDVVDWVWQAVEKGVVTEEEAIAIENTVTKEGEIEKAEADFVELLKSKGYDGLKYINQTEDKGSVSYVVFDSKQVDLAQPVAKAEPAKVVTEDEVKLTKTEEAAIAKLEAEVEEPFEMVRVKDVGFVIKEKATGKEAAVIAKRKEAKTALAEFNKKERKIKITRRKPKLLTDKTTVGKLITEARALKESIKKAARAAREAFTIGKREGIEKVKAHYFELKAREKERKELKGRVNKAVKSIKSKIPTSVDFFYREAIEALQSGIDPSFRAKKTLRQREKTKEFLAREPEALKDMPVKLIKALQKKSIGEYTVAELEQIATEIEKLKKLGKLKRKLKLQKRQREIEEVRSEIEENVSKGESIKAKKEPVVYSTTREGFVKTAWEKTKAWTWRPSRIFDMLDGRKKFAGKAHQFFVDQVNRATDAKLRMVDKRKNAGVEKMESLGVAFRGLTFIRTIDGVKYTVDEMIGIYNANKNRLAKLAIMYGNNLTENNIKNITDSLTESEKAWGDYIVQDYDNNYERLRQEVIRVENRDMGFEENYTPMRRTEIDYTTHTQEIIDEILQKESLRKAYAEHGFTIVRKEVPAEFQKPIRLNATSTWLSQIAKQEQYIHFAQLVKDMHKVASGISESVEQKYGKEFNKVIRNYIDRVASPNIYKSYNSLENLSRKLRQNAVIAYLAYNLVTMAKQIPSVFLYLQDAGPVHLLSSAMEFSTHPIDMVKMVREKDPQVKHRSIERELEEMKTNQSERYWAIVNKFGKAGMEGLYLFDAVARTIGWNAVYQKTLKSNKSEAEAVRLAQNATLRTQPAAAAKDLAQLYATNEFANWFTMFTNQLNQIYNIATYDFTGYVKNAEYQKVALTLTGLSITALTIWIIANRRLPEDAEDFANAMGEQAINAVPLIGKALMAGKRGWGGTEIPAFEFPKAVGRSVTAVVEGKFDDKDLKAIAEGVAVISGIPYIGPKRVVKVVGTGELKELIGGEPIEKNGKPKDFGGAKE